MEADRSNTGRLGNRVVDSVMADWIGETNLQRIEQAARHTPETDDQKSWPLPPYLQRQQKEADTG